MSIDHPLSETGPELKQEGEGSGWAALPGQWGDGVIVLLPLTSYWGWAWVVLMLRVLIMVPMVL